MAGGLQLLLPGLFDLPLGELDSGFVRNDLPRLNRILGLATPRANRDYSLDAILSTSLGIRGGDAESTLAMAPAFAPDADSPGRLMLAEGVHLQADMQGAIAFPIAKTTDNIDDLYHIINDLKDLFILDCDFSAVADGVFLMRLKAFDAPTHYPHPLSVLGKNVNPFIEQSRQVLPWYRLVNEFQMFMHQHPVNQRRQQQGRLPINSLWTWGAGPLAETGERPAWYCDDELLNRFAGSLGLPLAGCARLATAELSKAAVIVDLRLLQLLKSGSDSPFDELLLDIERQLLAPIAAALKSHPQPLRLRAGHRVDLELSPLTRFKFWRRPGSLFDWRD